MSDDMLSDLATSNLVTFLEQEALKHGTDSQRERWLHHVLPEDELLQLARNELFRGFVAFERWHTNEGRRQMRHAMHHGKGEHRPCRYIENRYGAPLEFEVTEVSELTGREWNTLKAIRAAAEAIKSHPWIARVGGDADVAVATHWAECSDCHAEVTRSVAKVSITWAGRVLVREYLLS